MQIAGCCALVGQASTEELIAFYGYTVAPFLPVFVALVELSIGALRSLFNSQETFVQVSIDEIHVVCFVHHGKRHAASGLVDELLLEVILAPVSKKGNPDSIDVPLFTINPGTISPLVWACLAHVIPGLVDACIKCAGYDR